MSTRTIAMKTFRSIRRASLSLLSRHYSSKNYKSALFITGNRATDDFAFLTPYFDFDQRFSDMQKLQAELKLRNLDVNAEELKKSWDFYKNINLSQLKVDEKRDQVAHAIRKLQKKTELNDEEKQQIQGLKVQGKVLKEEVKNIKSILWDIEDSVITKLLALPNEIDDKTPLEPVILRSVGKKPQTTHQNSHIVIGESLKLIDYKSPMHYYLCNDAALFEIGVLSWIGKTLGDEGLIKVAGTDFSRSFVVEAAGMRHYDPLDAFILANNEAIDKKSCNRLHLTGGASLISFLVMHTKQLINPQDFPLGYYATGRYYSPPVEPAVGLFNVCQESVVHCLSMVKDPESPEHQVEMQKLLSTTMRLYDALGRHYRVVMRPAGELEAWESLRISFEMWSCHLQQYVEVGHISSCGTYLSKRLLIAYQTSKGRDYPAIISGTILSVPRLLGCLLEENPVKFEIPPPVILHMPANDPLSKN